MIVCDVFSNPPSLKDPGCVVHQGLGRPRRMRILLFFHSFYLLTFYLFCGYINILTNGVMAVDNGGSLTAYAGPVFDYYEFELEGLQVHLLPLSHSLASSSFTIF